MKDIIFLIKFLFFISFFFAPFIVLKLYSNVNQLKKETNTLKAKNLLQALKFAIKLVKLSDRNNRGFCSNEIREKEGNFLNKNDLIGKWNQDNMYYGKFFYDNNNKTKYIGYFNKNKKFEVEGEFFLNNENKTRYYKGFHKNGLPNGNGIIYYENGNKHYVGSIKDGYFHGEGLEYYEDEQLMYNGTFKNGEKNGKGIFF